MPFPQNPLLITLVINFQFTTNFISLTHIFIRNNAYSYPFFILFLIIACSLNDVKNVVNMNLNYRVTGDEKPEDGYIKKEVTIKTFIDTVNNAEELDDQMAI